MLFNLNQFLRALSFALDFVEIDILGVTSNHGKRTAYISLRIAKELGFSKEELHDISALGILHDNGVSEKVLHDKYLSDISVKANSVERVLEHCIISEENISEYPFLTEIKSKNILKYHHENYNGTGFFKLKGDEIPLMSTIIHLADIIDVSFRLEENKKELQNEVLGFVNRQINKMFCPQVVAAFNSVGIDKSFWENLKNERVGHALVEETPTYSMDLPIEEVAKVTGVFSKIIDSKSHFTRRHSRDLSVKAAIMADYYNMEHEEKMKFVIAANLHDIGKLAVPNEILDSNQNLDDYQFEVIKKHPMYTRLALQEIDGFEDITEWAANHHEKLNGRGYPFGKTAEELDFNSRLMGCLDIYEALTEERPYRKTLSHKAAMDILNKMKWDGFIDAKITEDIDTVFAQQLS